jgi:DinB superfamily
MSNAAETKVQSGLELRILNEGYGPGAWHGADFKAALSDVNAKTAFERPGPGRHNIAEIALHHAYCVRNVRGQLTGVAPEPFLVEGDDWFEAANESLLTWRQILDVVNTEHERLAEAVSGLEQGTRSSPLADADRFALVLGITCHAVYHAGQIQLIKRLVK